MIRVGEIIAMDGGSWCPVWDDGTPEPGTVLYAQQPAQGEASPEDEAERFIQAAIDRALEPLRRLGEYLTSVLDEDQWPTAERLLLAIAIAPPEPAVPDELREVIRDACREWQGYVDVDTAPMSCGDYVMREIDAWIAAAPKVQPK